MIQTNFENGVSYEDVLAQAIDGLFVIDRDRKCVLFSQACEKITGYPSEAVVGGACRCHEVTDCHDDYGRSLSGLLCPSLLVFDGTIPHARQRMTIRRRDGRTASVETTYSPIRNPVGSVTHVVGIMRDMTDSKETAADLDRIARKLGAEASPITVADAADVLPSATNRGPQPHGASASLDQVLGTIEKDRIMSALAEANGQRTLAAKMLGISRSRLYRRMEALGIASGDGHPAAAYV